MEPNRMNRMVVVIASVLILELLFKGCMDAPQGSHLALKANPVAVTIDGKLTDGEWENANVVRGFVKPWDEGPDNETTLWVQSDSSYFYFAFDVADKQIVVVPVESEQAVASGDRVELFFAGDKDLADYYCFEMGPDGRVLDYRASFYRQFDNAWDFPDLDVIGVRNDRGYVVEGKIPFSKLNELGIVKQRGTRSFFFMGAYRGEYSTKNQGDTTIQWITWVDPDVADPDFHIPSSFGEVSYDLPIPPPASPRIP